MSALFARRRAAQVATCRSNRSNGIGVVTTIIITAVRLWVSVAVCASALSPKPLSALARVARTPDVWNFLDEGHVSALFARRRAAQVATIGDGHSDAAAGFFACRVAYRFPMHWITFA